MRFTIPVLVRNSGGDESVYLVSPLFYSEPVERAPLLGRAMSRLTRSLRRLLDDHSREQRLDALASFGYCPPMQDHLLKVEFPYEKRTARVRFLFVVLTESRLVFCPNVPGLWFQLHRGERLKDKVPGILERFFAQSRDEPEEWALEGKAWTTVIEVDKAVPEVPPKKPDLLMALLGGPAVGDGRQELEAVGRCLDDLYPDDLVICVARERAEERLRGLLNCSQGSPVLIVGPRKVGKTALVHQQVRWWMENREPNQGRRFWHLSPQRLISGMAYVGQWENRLLAILKHAAKNDLVLYFDDLLGLFQAGISRDAQLSVADVLKPYLQRREVRLLAEMTPEALSILRERDRGFADLFAIHLLEETSEQETLEILLAELRKSERTHGCKFEIEALSAILDVQRRYGRDAAFPGKAAVFLRKLAARHRRAAVTRLDVMEHFHATSGLLLQVLDDRVCLRRESVVEALQQAVIGQDAAVRSVAEAVILAKARLTDPERPIASYLFVGPTGVGKTHCARALATYLFGDETRMLRFDMNEFVSPLAPARLVGTFQQPDGLLTGAVRRQPFCVVLLDEIEKAHPDVFNLLLQVMGDGRLTDSLGRTVDFTQSILIMTSNLGAREAGRPVGFRSKEAGESQVFRRAVEQFFPPEFFNRLDRVVPFSRLSREDVGHIARGLLERLLAREGLVRRQCILEVEDQAMDRIVDRGFHPQLGARALKRAVEREIAAPVARRLAEMRPDSPTLIEVHPRGSGVEVTVSELLPAERGWYASMGPLGDLGEKLWQAIGYRLDVLEKRLAELSPEGAVGGEEMSPEALRYFETQDRIRQLRGISRTFSQAFHSPRQRSRPRKDDRHRPLLRLAGSSGWPDPFQGPELRLALRDLSERLPVTAQETRWLGKAALLLGEYFLLELPAEEEEGMLTVGWPVDGRAVGEMLADHYRVILEDMELTVESRAQSDRHHVYRVEGPQTGSLLASEQGIHLFCTENSGLVPVTVRTGQESPARVLRVYDSRHGTLDLRTGWMLRGLPDPEELRLLLATALPPPDEFLALLGGETTGG